MTDSTLRSALDELTRAGAAVRRAPASSRRVGAVLRRAVRYFLVFLALGAAANVALAYALGLFLDVSQGRVETSAAWSGSHQWTVTRWSRPGAAYILSVREPGANWSPGQATGPPDTPTGGDRVTAWASQTQDGQREWLLLDYAQAVEPRAVRVYEINSTGAVDRVTAFDASGKEVEAWAGADPTPPGGSIATSEIPLRPLGFATKRIKVYLDSQRVKGWNEIDAVGLVGPKNKVQWAEAVEASSTYASSAAGMAVSGGTNVLAPAWTGLQTATEDMIRRRIAREQRAVDARGWPMLALWGRIPPARLAAQTGSASAGNTSLTVSGSAALSYGFLVGASGPAGGAPTAGQPPLLVHPIWPGFAVNSLVFAVVLGGLYWALTVPRRFVRELGRMRRGCCVACGYDLGFDFAPGCPECGWRRKH